MNYQTHFIRFAGILLSLTAFTSFSHAADVFPSKPLKIIVTAAPGGTTDIASRALADQLGRELGQSVLVENKAGAAGIIALQALIASPADGYTMAMGNIGTNAINYALYKSLPYKSEDMRAISVVLATPNVMVGTLHYQRRLWLSSWHWLKQIQENTHSRLLVEDSLFTCQVNYLKICLALILFTCLTKVRALPSLTY